MQTMTTSFTVRPVTSAAELDEACTVRAESYGHHVPALRSEFAEPDALDEDPACTSFIARDKASGLAVGTLRVQLGHVAQPLMLESSHALAPELAAQTRAELTRMSVLPGADALVRLVLWKAGLYFCLANQVQCMVIGARRPALIRQYQSLGFAAVSASAVPFAHAGGLPHWVLHLDVRSLERRWHAENHAMHGFMFDTHHPDLSVIGTAWRPVSTDQCPDISGIRLDAEKSAPSQRVSMA